MNGQILIANSLFAGVLIGLLFFAGLWWTVQKAMSTKQPGLLFAGSFLLRTGLALATFYFIGSGSWQRLLICLVGFVLGRSLVKRFSQSPPNIEPPLLEEGVR